jgi:mannose-6-phosphate isomerase-like protein (cupin superfamily)
MLSEILKNGSHAYIIDENGLEHEISFDQIDYYIAENKKTIKIEGLESYYTSYLPKTVHMYISPKDAISFDFHKDPYDVLIKVLSGTKTFIIDNRQVEIKDEFIIPKDTPHKATNKYSSVMLSIGE